MIYPIQSPNFFYTHSFSPLQYPSLLYFLYYSSTFSIMNNNMKNMTKKKKKMMMMRGFMCQTPASTAVCMNPEFGSVIVPRRVADHHHRSSLININDDARLTNNAKYTRLIQSNRFNQLMSTTDKKSVFVPSINNNNNNNNNEDQVSRPRDPNLPQKHPSLPDSSNHVFQVVVMRVSLHCQGCAGKVKKHLSKMEGVTSFSIDLETKRVTVMGHVSPVGVLESISKVKKAEFWSC